MLWILTGHSEEHEIAVSGVTVRYATFKNLEWTMQKPVLAIAAHRELTMACVFVVYLQYGMVLPCVSKRWRREVEVEDPDEEANWE
jgi:hypothetical protein